MKKLLIGFLLLTVCKLISYSQANFNNQIIVYFKTGVQRVLPANNTSIITSPNILNVLSNYGVPTSNVLPSFPEFNASDTINAEVGENSRQMNRAKVFTITVTNSTTKNNLITALNNLSEVLYAESNGTISNNLIPIDTRFGQQWGMRNTIVPGSDIHVEQAWDIFTGNPNAIIAIIDNGVDANHNDLNAKILGGDNNFQITLDNLGRQISHGSHVAGIAAAITNNNNNNGVAGVDWQSRIHPQNIFDEDGDPDITRSIINAVNFNNNVWTLNHSWSTRNLDNSPGRYSVTVRSAFAHAYRNNRVSCIAMGNHQEFFPNQIGFPAGINSGVITVGASDITDNIAGFSANGPHIDVSAPGVGIQSTNFNNQYIDISGTSMAAPHVAGLASLLKGFNTFLANDDIEQIIRLSADDVNAVNGFPGFDNQMGNGRINAQRALQFLQAPNTVQHLSTTGGTIFSTSASMNRVFLGVPGFVDGNYVVRRKEVRKNVSFPAMCSIIGVWGRGVGTTGFREENGRSFGEGICEIVPGTLTNTSATLRTWIYEVWSINGQYIGFSPSTANNVVFQYTILGIPSTQVSTLTISGPDLICNTADYLISNLPTSATVSWSIPSSAGAVLQLAHNTPVQNQLRITNQRWYGVNTTLIANISNLGCNIPNQTRVMSIANDNSTSGTVAHPYYQEACTFNGVPHSSQTGTIFSNSAPVFVHMGCMVYVNLGDMAGRTVTLGTGSGTPLLWGVGSTSYYQNTLYFKLPLGSGGIPFTFNINGNGACFQRSLLFFPYGNNARISFAATPNPVTNQLFVTAKENEKYLAENKLSSTKDKLQFTMNIYDLNSNTLQIAQRSITGNMQHTINVSKLKTGYYVLQIINGQQSESIKFFKE